MRPGQRFLQAVAVFAAVGLLVPLIPQIAWALAVAFVAVVTVAVSEWRMLKRLEVLAERDTATVLSLNEIQPVDVRLRTNANYPVRMFARQLFPDIIEERALEGFGTCRPGELLDVKFPVRSIARGSAALEGPYVAISKWGLVERILQVGATTQLTVLPNLRAVKRMHQQLNQYILRGMGNRVAPRLGKGREFDRLREYVRDDDYRDIAWKASARHTQLIVREFRLDRSQDILICVDRGHRMAARSEHVTKVDHAVNASVVISYICNRMEDRVGILSFGADVNRGIPQGRGPEHLRQVTAFAAGIGAEYIHTDYTALAIHLRRRLRRRTLILIMTDLPEGRGIYPLVKAVRMLTPQHLPLVVVMSDPAMKAAADFVPGNHVELCRSLVAREMLHERQQAMKELRSFGAMVVDTTAAKVGVEAINAYMDVKRRQLL
jgi:uncharacterized protein (DUF58 family)